MRYNKIDPGFFNLNRKRLADRLKPGSVALVFSNYQMPRNGDQYFPYRQHSDFFYLTGIEQEKSILLLAPDAPSDELKEVLFVLKSNKTLEIWEGHKLTPEEATKISDIKTIRPVADFESTLHSLLADSEHVYLNVPEFPKFIPEVPSWDTEIVGQIKTKYPLHNTQRLAPLLKQLRLIKSKTEIELIRQACSITKSAFLEVLPRIKPGIKEYEIEALVSFVFLSKRASGHAYAPIIASGKNACALHYIENKGTCRKNELLLMDMGAEYGNYAADLSRTIPVNGKYNTRQRELYDATLNVFKFARNCIKPGTTINEFHKKVCALWEEEHLKLGLYTTQDIKNHKGDNPLWHNYFMHGTSHFLGLDVHDAGTRETVLQPGMVLTCEPGIYIAEEKTGIRIENDIYVTETGSVDLMEDIPMEAEEIEILMNP